MIIKIIQKDDNYYNTQTLIDNINKNSEIDSCGAIYTFTGFVRGKEENKIIKKLTLTTGDIEKSTKDIEKIAEKAKIKYGIKQANIIHYIGEFYTGDPLFQVAVLGAHRDETKEALDEIIEKVKHEVDFKKEIESDDGTEVILAGG